MPAQGKSNHYPIIAVVAFIIIATSIGFLLFTKRPADKTSEVVLPFEPGKIEVKDELIEGFPELPVYPEATTISSYKKQEGKKVGFEANWEVDASVSEVMTWYIDALKETGWVFEEEPEDLDEIFEQSLIAQKDEIRVYLIVGREEGAEKAEISAEFPVQ